MNTKIQSVHFDADKKLLDFVEDKIAKLPQVFDKITSCEVILKLDKADSKENKIAELKVHIPGSELFAKKQCATFEEAIDLTTDAIRTQIKKHKDKLKV